MNRGKPGDKGDLKAAKRAAAQAAEAGSASDEEAAAAAAAPTGRRKRKHAEDAEPEFERPRQKLSAKQSREQKLAEQLPIRSLTGELVYQRKGLQQSSEVLILFVSHSWSRRVPGQISSRKCLQQAFLAQRPAGQ